MIDLPRGWSVGSIPDLLGADGVFSDGDWVESKDQDPFGEVRLIQLADVGEGVFRDRSSRFLISSTAERLACTYLQPGDVLVARMPDPLGRACIFPGVSEECVTVVDVCIVRPGAGAVEPRWLMSALNAPQMRSRVSALQAGTTRKRISRRNLGTIELPIPPLAEQRRIVAAIEERFSRLDAAEKIVVGTARRLTVLSDTVLSAAVVRCESVALQTLLREPLRNGHSAKAAQGGSVRTLTLTAVTKRTFSDEYTKITAADPARVRDLWLKSGDILVERANTPELVGTAALYRGPDDWAIFPDLLIRVRPTDAVVPEYLEIVLRSRPARHYFQAAAQGIAGSMPKIDQGAVEKLPVPLPSIPEQRRIVAEVEQRLSVIDATRAAVESARRRGAALRRSILERAFRGELVPQDPSDEPASVLLQRIRAERGAQEKPRRARGGPASSPE